MLDSSTYTLAVRGIAILAVTLTALVALALSPLIGVGLAVVTSCLIVGPAVHVLVGKAMRQRPDRWGALGDGIIVAGITYPLLLWVGGTIYVGLTRSLVLAAVVAVGPLVILVVAAVLWDDDRRPGRAALRDRQAFAGEHRWRFLADGTEVLRAHWSAASGEQPDVSASAVLAGELDGWPVTICNTVDHRARHDQNLTVTWLVHLPVSLPRTVAVPYDSREFESRARGAPWEAMPVAGYPSSVEHLHLASADAAFGRLLAAPNVRQATVEGDLMFWRIVGRDLSLARRAATSKSVEDVLRTASRLVALAQALPADALVAYGTPLSQAPPFREPAPGEERRDRPSA